MALALNNAVGNGGNNPSRSLLAHMGFETPYDLLEQSTVEMFKTHHDEIVGLVSQTDCPYYQVAVCKVSAMKRGIDAPVLDFHDMAQDIFQDERFTCLLYGLMLFCPSIYHQVMTTANTFKTTHPHMQVEAGVIMGCMIKFTTGWFGGLLNNGAIKEHAVTYSARMICTFLDMGCHPAVPLNLGGRMAEDGTLPNLNRNIVLGYLPVAGSDNTVVEAADDSDDDGDGVANSDDEVGENSSPQ